MQDSPPKPEIVQLKSAANTIFASIYEPTTPSGITLIMNSATGAKQSYFRHFAHYFAERQIRVITYDYSGIGLSAPKNLKGYQTTMTQWGTHDLTVVIDYVSSRFENQKIILVGQSVGGQIPPLSPSIGKIHGLVNVASQSGYWKLWDMPLRLLVRFNWFIMPMITRTFGYFPGKAIGVVGNLPKGVALDWVKWGTSPEYLIDCIPNAKALFDAVKLPLLAYSFDDDTTAPRQTVEWLNRQYTNCDVEHRHIKAADIGVGHIGHFGFFRPKCAVLWQEVFKEITNW